MAGGELFPPSNETREGAPVRPPAARSLNIHEAFVALQAELAPIRGTGHNDQTKSRYVTFEDLMRMISPLLQKYKLGLVFSTLTVEKLEPKERDKGAPMTGFAVCVEALLTNGSGETMTASAWAAGYEALDKGLAIAQSAARRLALNHLFAIREDDTPPQRSAPPPRQDDRRPPQHDNRGGRTYDNRR